MGLFDNIPLPIPFPIPPVPGPVGDLIDYLVGAGISAPAAQIVTAYFGFLEQQASGQLKSIPEALRGLMAPHFSFSLDDVRYAENINTVHGQAITVEYHIYFPSYIDLTDCSYIHWLIHELEHCGQYKAHGGKAAFLAKYVAQLAFQILRNRSFNVYDIVGLEQDAEAKANNLAPAICESIGSTSPVPRPPRDNPWHALYVIQNSKLHRVNPADGSYAVLPGDWGGLTSIAAFSGSLYVIQNSKLHRVNPADGSYAVLPGDWGGLTSMTTSGGSSTSSRTASCTG